MVDTIAADTKLVIGDTIKTFGNLLKEFPKTESDEFVYDDSTLKKIGAAGKSLTQWARILDSKSNSPGDSQQTIKSSLHILSQLMEELPKDSSDEFWYDRSIHKLVEDARQTIANLNHIIS